MHAGVDRQAMPLQIAQSRLSAARCNISREHSTCTHAAAANGNHRLPNLGCLRCLIPEGICYQVCHILALDVFIGCTMKPDAQKVLDVCILSQVFHGTVESHPGVMAKGPMLHGLIAKQ
eukprot:GHRR01037123.1.p1 GENE.GHRR01037123.1~~GHRR01037123.1.p1  ORF type:complete len:119 (+),score=16.54 GHRR01037123.1:360-716(+)